MKETILKIVQAKRDKNLEDAFAQWKFMITTKEQEETRDKLNHFNQEYKYLKQIEQELQDQIKQIDRDIQSEEKEQQRTKIWLDTKYKQEERKVRLQSQKLCLDNSLYINRVSNTIPAFYKLLIHSKLTEVKETYKREMQSASEVFVYEGKNKRRIFNASKIEMPRQIKRQRGLPESSMHGMIPTRQQQVQKAVVRQFEIIKQREAVNKVEQVYKRDKNFVKYDQIIRAIKFVQRKFRESKMTEKIQEMKINGVQFDNKSYKAPIKIKFTNQACVGGVPNNNLQAGEVCDTTTDSVACDPIACDMNTGYQCINIPGAQSVCTEVCGDGLNMGRKPCDDDNVTPRDGCSHTCTVESGWTCSGGSVTSQDTCKEICGDGKDFFTYPCDDGIPNGGGCDNSCNLVTGYDCQGGDPFHADQCFDKCGDGINLGLRACDDGNLLPGDGCDRTCNVEDGYSCTAPLNAISVCAERCGDGFDMGTNQCDDKNTVSGDGCDDNCNVELGWTCGTGNFARFDLCFEVCGDGRSLKSLSPMGNMCDDGNNYNGDGCDADCVLEYGYSCTGGDLYNADTCTETCGDGYNIGINQCDDGNTLSGDGCSSTCQVEAGWTCSGGTMYTKDTCKEICGDGRDFYQYQCDDGNLVNGDGCSSTCTIEKGYTCTGGSATGPDLCWRPYPRVVTAALSANSTVITLTFNETTFMASTFTKDDFLIYITGPRDVYQFTFDVLNLNYYRGQSAGFSTLEIQITFEQSGQFFGLGAEGVIFAVRNGANMYNYRGGTLIQNVFVMYSGPRESDYKCGLDGLWQASYWVLIIFFVINVIAFFFEQQLFSILTSRQSIHELFLGFGLFLLDTNGSDYNIYTNFLGNTFWDLDLVNYATTFWYGYLRQDIFQNLNTPTNFLILLRDAADVLNCWLVAILMLFFFNFMKALFPKEPYFVETERNYRWYAFYKGLEVGNQKIIFCIFMNMLNIHFDNSTLQLSVTLSAFFLAAFVAFPIVNSLQAYKYRKVLKEEDIRELVKTKWIIQFGDYAKTSFVRYFYIWAFCLRRMLNAIIILTMQYSTMWQLNLLLFVNALALVHHIIARPFASVLLNLHTLITDVGILIVIGEMYRFRYPFLSDAEFYFLGQVVIGTIATIIFLHFVLFIISLLLGLCDFCKKYCCKKKKIKEKEKLIIDPKKDLNISSIDEIYHTPTPEPTPPPTPPPKEPTPEPTPPPTPPKTPTPEESEDEPEYILPAAAVLVKENDNKF